jgi:LacI family transcriptional regulator
MSSDDVLELLLERRPAGVAFFPECRMPIQRSVALAEAKDIPCVALDSSEGYADTVAMDRPQGVYEAVKYLVEKGRKRVAYLGYLDETCAPPTAPWAVFGGRTRLDGYERAIAELGLEPIILPVGAKVPAYEGGRNGAKLLMAASSGPDAVQVYSDQMAAGLLAGLHEQGVRVPEDVAVVGFGDIEVASLVWPRLTTVAQPGRPLAEAAAEVLVKKMNGEERPAGGWSRTLPTRLVVREST